MVGVSLSVVTCQVRADDGDACADAYEAAQVEVRELRWRAAREQLAICDDLCPDELRKDCVLWVEELERDQPTLRLTARDPSGRTIAGVRGTVDGRAVDGETLGVDPGKHSVRFVHPNGSILTEEVTLAPGEHRDVVVVFAVAPAPAVGEESSGEAIPEAVPWVLGALGLVAVGVGVGLAVKGRLDLDELERTCAPNCAEGPADEVRRLWTAAATVGALGGVLAVSSIAIGITVAVQPGERVAARVSWQF